MKLRLGCVRDVSSFFTLSGASFLDIRVVKILVIHKFCCSKLSLNVLGGLNQYIHAIIGATGQFFNINKLFSIALIPGLQ